MKVKGASSTYDIKSEYLSPDFIFYSLVIGPFHSCVISTPPIEYSLAAISRVELIAISVLPGTNFHLSQVKNLEVSCPRTQHRNKQAATFAIWLTIFNRLTIWGYLNSHCTWSVTILNQGGHYCLVYRKWPIKRGYRSTCEWSTPNIDTKWACVWGSHRGAG